MKLLMFSLALVFIVGPLCFAQDLEIIPKTVTLKNGQSVIARDRNGQRVQITCAGNAPKLGESSNCECRADIQTNILMGYFLIRNGRQRIDYFGRNKLNDCFEQIEAFIRTGDCQR